jgi:hypothetical protein
MRLPCPWSLRRPLAALMSHNDLRADLCAGSSLRSEIDRQVSIWINVARYSLETIVGHNRYKIARLRFSLNCSNKTVASYAGGFAAAVFNAINLRQIAARFYDDCRNQAITLTYPAQGHDECNGDLSPIDGKIREGSGFYRHTRPCPALKQRWFA